MDCEDLTVSYSSKQTNLIPMLPSISHLLSSDSWLVKNGSSIFAGVISSFIVLSLQTSIKIFAIEIHEAIRRRIHLCKLWGFKNPSKIYLVSGSIDMMKGASDDSELAFLAAPDAVAVMALRYTLEILYPNAIIIHTFSPTFGADLFEENIVTVGGPINNSCTKIFLDEIGHIRFEGLSLVTPDGPFNLERPEHQARVATDYGLVLVRQNPFNSLNRCIIVAGCDTNGVLAAAKALQIGLVSRRVSAELRKRFRKRLFMNVKSAYVVLKTRAIGNIAGEPTVVAAKELN